MYPNALPRYVTCHACGEMHRADLTGANLRTEALAALAVRDESPVCQRCAARAEREVDAELEEAELAADPTFAEHLAARSEETLAHMIASGFGDEPALPWSLAWCDRTDALTSAVSL